MREHHRGTQHQDVVMVGGAAQKRARVFDVIAGLEAEPVAEERRGGVEVGGADDHVAKLARGYRACPHNPRGARACPLRPAGPVIGRRIGHGLLHARRDLQHCQDPGDGVAGGQRPGGRVAGGVDPQPVQAGRCPVEVIRIVHADPELDQAPGGRGSEPELAAAVTRGEPALAIVREPELPVVGGGLLRVGYPQGERRQLMQGHEVLLTIRTAGDGGPRRQTSGVIFSSTPSRALPYTS